MTPEPSLARIDAGGIIAAGDGSRLKRDGFAAAKPLVEVAGAPLVEHVIRNFQAAGIAPVSVIFNERERDCAAFVSSRFPASRLDVLVKTTPSSLVSFFEIMRIAAPGRLLVSTVDAFLPVEDFVAFARAAAAAPPDAVVLAVTPFVADEKPLRARLDADGRIRTLGGEDGNVVTAGLYVVPARLRSIPRPDFPRLRDFLRSLVEEGETVIGIPIARVIDVDRAEDVALAEEMAARSVKGGAA